MKNKRISIILLIAALIFAAGLFGLTGCAKEPAPEEPGNEAPTEQNYRIALFYANDKYLTSGDESLEKFIVYEEEITSAPDEVYLHTLEKLRAAPEEGCGTMLGDQIEFNQVYLDGDTAYVDFSSDGLSGGSLEETFLISQIVNTLVNSFTEVNQVQFLVDGEVPETLMGHVGAESPFTKDVFSE